MAVLLLAIIYLAFISLGLPDSMLGVAWPILHVEFAVSEGLAGIFGLIATIGTIVSTTCTGKLTARFGVGKVVAASAALTAVSLLAVAFIQNIYVYFAIAVPLGMGAGAVDASLNDYVANHYKSSHMNWLHCCWGAGAMIGPLIMAACIDGDGGWRLGYIIVAAIQGVLAVVLFVALPLWKKVHDKNSLVSDELLQIAETEVNHSEGDKQTAISYKEMFKTRGLLAAAFSLFFYCSAEILLGLWGSSYLVNIRGVDVVSAARWVSFFYGGIMIGRVISGFISNRVNSDWLVRAGIALLFVGVLLLLLPIPSVFAMVGMILIGIGCGPVFPTILYLTPARFGERVSASAIGLQMSIAYTGSLIPIVFGYIAEATTFELFVYYLVAAVVMTFVCNERAVRATRKTRVSSSIAD